MASPPLLFSISNDPVYFPLGHWNVAFDSNLSLSMSPEDAIISETAWQQIEGSLNDSIIATIGNLVVGNPTIKIYDPDISSFTQSAFAQTIINTITAQEIQTIGNYLISTYSRNNTSPFMNGDILVFPFTIRPGQLDLEVKILNESISGAKFFSHKLADQEVLIKDGGILIDDEWLFTTNYFTGPYVAGTYDVGYSIEISILITNNEPPPPGETNTFVSEPAVINVPSLIKRNYSVTDPIIPIPSNPIVYLNANETSFSNGMKVGNWNGFVQQYDSQRPIYFSSGGYNGGPFVRFNRSNLQYLQGGRRELNIGTNGGFSVVAVFKFFGTAGSYERIFDFWDGIPNSRTESTGLARYGVANNLLTAHYNKNAGGYSITYNIFSYNMNLNWNVLAFSAINSSQLRMFDASGNHSSTINTGMLCTDKTPPYTYIGRSNYTSNDYSNLDLAYLTIYDRPLSDIEMSNVIRHFTTSSVATTPPFYVFPSLTEKLNNTSFEAGPTTTLSSTLIDDTTNPLESWDTSGVYLIRTENVDWNNPIAVNGLYVVGLSGTDSFISQDISNIEINAPYTLSFRIRNRRVSENPVFRITWIEGNVRTILLQEEITNLTTFVKRTSTIIPTGTQGTIEFRNIQTASSTIFLDAISLVKESKLILKKFPPTALSITPLTTITGQEYGNGVYNVSASSVLSSQTPHLMFDENTLAIESLDNPAAPFYGWRSNGGYNPITGAVSSGWSINGIFGDWVKIELPHAIILRKYIIYPRFLYNDVGSPSTFSIVGSNNNNDWTLLDRQVGLYWNTEQGRRGEKHFYIQNNNHYRYYALVIEHVGNQNRNVLRDKADILEWEIYEGIREPERFLQYPPAAMISSTTEISGQSYGNGSYMASSSGNLNGTLVPYKVFTHSADLSDGWSSQGLYNPSTGEYTGFTNLAGTPGEWIKIQLPEAIILKKYRIYGWGEDDLITSHRGPSSFILYGSNDDTAWTEIDSQTDLYWSLNTNIRGDKSFYLSQNQDAYSYYTIVVTKVGVGANGNSLRNSVMINEWQLFKMDDIPILIEFPPKGVTQNLDLITGQSYGNGAYDITTSSVESLNIRQGYYAFDNDISSTNYWSSDIDFDSLTGEYTGSNILGTTSGEWIKIKLPEGIILKRCVIYPRWDSPAATLNRSPRKFKIMASNNDYDWVVLRNYDNMAWNVGEGTQGDKTFFLDTNTASYSYYAIVVSAVGSGDETSINRERVDIGEWKLFTSSDSPTNYYQLLGEISPVFWFDPVSEAQFELVDGSLISRWYNKLNRSIYLLQNNSTDRPIYDYMNDRITVTRGNYLDFNSPITLLGESSLFIVITPSTLSDSYIFSNTTEPNSALAIVTGLNNTKSFEFYDTTLQADIDPTPFTENTSLHIISIIFSDSKLNIFYDGQHVVEDQAFVSSTEEITRLFESSLTGTGNGFQGTFAEIMYLDYTTNQTQRQRIEGYLANKHQLTSSLVPSHPYYGSSFASPGAPLNILLTSSTITEGNSIGDIIGFLSTIDNDTNDTFTYSIVEGDVNDFMIDGDILRANNVFNYSITPVYTITIRSVDSYGLFIDIGFNISVLPA